MLIEYRIENNKPIIYIFYYKDGKKIIKKVKDFEPYFYILENENVPKINEIVRIEKVETKSLFGEKLKKIVVNLPSDVPKIREKFSKTFEADILFTIRYTIDEIKQIPYEKLRIQYLDIENDDSKEPDIANKPITIIGCWDNFLEKYILFTWKEREKEREFKNKDLSIYYFNNEKDLLKNYINFINDTSPDIITGWNIVHFDIPILKAQNLNCNWAILQDFPLCILNLIKNKELSWKGRYLVILYMKEKGYSKEDCYNLLKGVLSERKLRHCIIEEKQLQYLYNRNDLVFPSCKRLKQEGFCIEKCKFYENGIYK